MLRERERLGLPIYKHPGQRFAALNSTNRKMSACIFVAHGIHVAPVVGVFARP